MRLRRKPANRGANTNHHQSRLPATTPLSLPPDEELDDEEDELLEDALPDEEDEELEDELELLEDELELLEDELELLELELEDELGVLLMSATLAIWLA